MTTRVYNFSAGPAMLPLSVLEEAQRDLLALPDTGMSVLEMSHRASWVVQMMEEAEANLRTLLAIPKSYQVLFLQGGARLQFSMVPMNFLHGAGRSADYVLTGSWGTQAFQDAKVHGPVKAAWDGTAERFVRAPKQDELTLDPSAAYVHMTSNETIHGVQFHTEPKTGEVPLVCDAASDFLSRPVPVSRYGLLYACAQKNAGPAGVTIVILREDLLGRIPDGLPPMLDYRVHVKSRSAHNTPPVFAIYIVLLVTRWLRAQGGLEQMAEQNRRKAALVYDAIDQGGGFYRGHARPECRSVMNVTWTLTRPDLEQDFLKQAAARGLCELQGHRSVGGFRASLYNAMPIEGAQALRDFLLEFHRQHA